jgi:hypothetical protein
MEGVPNWQEYHIFILYQKLRNNSNKIFNPVMFFSLVLICTALNRRTKILKSVYGISVGGLVHAGPVHDGESSHVSSALGQRGGAVVVVGVDA